jgi:hypothetical protein
MKSIFLVFSEGSEMEIFGNIDSYESLSDEYMKYMKTGEQEIFNFYFENKGELLINFDELVAIYSEDVYEDEDED